MKQEYYHTWSKVDLEYSYHLDCKHIFRKTGWKNKDINGCIYH